MTLALTLIKEKRKQEILSSYENKYILYIFGYDAI